MTKSVNAHLEDDTVICFDELDAGLNTLRLGYPPRNITIFIRSEEQRKKLIDELSKLEVKEEEK